MMWLGRYGLCVGLWFGILGGCSNGSNPASGEPSCTPGASKGCTCGNAPGAKTCDDRGRFGACVCASGTGGSTSGGTGGTGGSTSGGAGGSGSSPGGTGGTVKGGAGGALAGTGGTAKGGTVGAGGALAGTGGNAKGGAGGGGGALAGTGGTASGGTGGSGVPRRLCRPVCSSPADCATPNSPAYDADNYTCQNGACIYAGCLSDAECNAQTPGWLCRLLPLVGTKACVKACGTPADCAASSGATYDADNYTCDSGGCTHHGCNNDAECNQDYPGRVCRPDGTGEKSCYPTCTTVQDCASSGGAAYDADNYACVSGLCNYLGCQSDAECASPTATYVCR
jgi:hypothetical protein